MDWTQSAAQSLQEVPFFIRPVVKKGVERMASHDGLQVIDEGFYAKAKAARGR